MKRDKGKAQAEAEQSEVPVGISVAQGLIVKRFREELRMTQVKLAERAGVSQTWISLVENTARTGRNKNPSPEILQRVAFALELSGLSELYRYAEQLTDESKNRKRIEEFIASA